ncbi:hypothetical protein ACHAXM_011526 [Skeletonema potamos]
MCTSAFGWLLILRGNTTLMGSFLLPCGLIGYILYERRPRNGEMIVPMATYNIFSVISGMTSTEPHLYLLQLARQCKRTVFRLPLPIFQIAPIPKLRQVFVVSDVQLARRILQDSLSDKPPEIYSSFEGITKTPVMFTSRNSNYTKSIRKMAHCAFSKKKQLHLIIKKHVDQWINVRLRELSTNGKSFDPVDEALYVTFFIICEAAFGHNATYDEYTHFTKSLDAALTEFAYRQSTNPLRRVFWFLLPGCWKARRAAKVVMEFAELMRQAYNTSGNDIFMDSLQNNRDILDAKQHAGEIIMFMAAGHETTGSMISNVMIQLAKHQHIQTKLRRSLLETKSGEKMEDNAYFKNILLEANRIFPVAPMGSTRETRRDFVLNDGTHIPAHSICFLPQYLSYRDTTVFDDEEVFNPDRWDSSTKDMIDTASLAFSLGPRSCPGKPLAMQELFYILPHLLLQYELHQEREGTAEYRVIMKHSNSLLKAKKVGMANASDVATEQEEVGSKNGKARQRNYIVRKMMCLIAVMLVVGIARADSSAGKCKSTDHQAPLKIAVITEPSPIGSYICGQSKRIEYLMNYLATNTNDTVELITAEIDNASKPSSWLGIPIHYTFGFGLPSYNQISISFDFTGKTLRELNRFRPDMIHVTTPGPLLFPSVIASRLFNIPIVMSCHTHLTAYAAAYLPPVLNKIAEWLLWRFIEGVHSFADLTLVTSPQIQEEFLRNRIATSLWKKGVNSTQFHPDHYNADMRSRMTGDHPEEFLITYIGRLAEEKRLTLLKGIIQNITGATLCVVGTGPHEGMLKSHFEGTKTIFLGKKTGIELSQAFASTDVFVMPSTSETLGFVVLESMASRVPVVAADAGGLKHLIQNATTGFLVSPDNAAEFIDRIQELKVNSTLRDRIADAARKDSERWTWESSMKALRFDLYPKALQNFEDRLYKKAWRLVSNWLHGNS